jgi:hypothetical protein
MLLKNFVNSRPTFEWLLASVADDSVAVSTVVETSARQA